MTIVSFLSNSNLPLGSYNAMLQPFAEKDSEFEAKHNVLSTRVEELELKMNRLKPLFDLADMTRNNRMDSSLELIIEQA